MGQPLREIRGELKAFPLADLVPVLAERAATGLLVVERGLKRRTFTLLDGSVVAAASNDPREYLGQYLVNVGLIGAESAARLYQEQEATKIPFARLLELRGVLDEERAREGLKLKIRESLLDTYRWVHGALHFRPGEVARGAGIDVAVKLMDVQREANGRAREWDAIAATFPSVETRLAPVEPSPWNGALQPEEELLLDMAREGCTVADALASFRDGEFQAYRRLMAMVRKELIAPDRTALEAPAPLPPPEALLNSARQLYGLGQLEEASRHASLAAERGAEGSLSLLQLIQTELALNLADRLLTLVGVPFIRPRGRELTRLDLTPAEMYLARQISLTRSLRDAIRRAPMGELRALEIVEKLIAEGVVGFVASGADQERESA